MSKCYAQQPSLKDVLDNPLKYPVESITIKPFTGIKNKTGDDYVGIKMDVEYKAGHIIHYRYDENIELLDKLIQLLTHGKQTI